ncbi:MAG: GyrI-like domain-containing protein [Salibacteraceae bacterium]|jgi:AraC family transcriptional regulator|nr:GyrI-like domain-containing protein [Salibacteraceae bacterium]MDP4844046.1 GyrI-like domain-containing protein [Salibacteraceae bacterium]MDP4964568.1 GyrI-like domain-containing protein [Salibacteraceae bacterium]
MNSPAPIIKTTHERKLIGMHMNLSLANHNVSELWQEFMQHLATIQHKMNCELVSVTNYPNDFFRAFDVEKSFEKWAAVEVSDFTNVPDNMETVVIPSGLYAVFQYKGSSANNAIFQYIFGAWLPQSEYQLDQRPHFEILGDKYKNNDPNSEEELWIPVKPKIFSSVLSQTH